VSQDKAVLAGAAAVDITPEMGIQIAGSGGRRRPVEEIRERIYVRALMLEQGETRFCILSLDLLSVTHEWVDEIRARAAQHVGIDPKAVMVHPLQNHSAPSLGNLHHSDDYDGIPDELWWLRGGDARYNEPTVGLILQAIERADAAKVPVSVHVGREIDGRAAFNRRFVMRDGTARMHPKAHERNDILYCEGPVDPEVGVLVLRGAGMENVAALLHYTCHPVHGAPNNYIIGDWPGAWVSGMQGPLGADCVPLVLNGCCGNVHHINHLDPLHVSNHIRMGSLLTESAGRAMRELELQDRPILSWYSTQVRIPLRRLSDEDLAAARQCLRDNPEPPRRSDVADAIAYEWDYLYAHSRIDLAARQARKPYYDYEVQAVRIADSAVLALTGEPFVEGQLRIKLESPFPYTFVAHMSNGYAGYVPTAEGLRRGGFEARIANHSQLAGEALDMICSAACEVLIQLYQAGI
jgi:hypothetical protein